MPEHRTAHRPTTVDRSVDATETDQAVVLDRRPKFQLPFGSEGPRASVVMAMVAAAVAGVVAAAIATPRAGLGVGAATLLVLLVPRLRFVLAIAAVTCVAAAGIYVAVHQAQLKVPDNGAWPQSFGEASEWAWAGVVFLGADGVVDGVLRARKRRLDRKAAASGGSTGDDPTAGVEATVGGGGTGDPAVAAGD